MLARVEAEAWRPEQAAGRDMLARRLECHPMGHFVLETTAGVVGFFFAIPVELDADHYPTWTHLAEQALSPLPSAPCWAGISLSVSPHASRGAATDLLRGVAGMLARDRARTLQYGARIPGFKQARAGGTSPESYVAGLRTGSIREPAVGAGLQAGGTIRGFLTDYFEDEASDHCAVLLRHVLAPG